MAATLRDIAKAANVSRSTVSRILNNDPTLSVNDSTRERVLDVAAGMNYSKHRQKRQSKVISRIAVVQWYSRRQELDDLYYMSIRMAIEQAALANNIQTVPIYKNDLAKLPNDVDGIIAIGKYSTEQVDRLRLVTRNLVFVDFDSLAFNFDCIVPDFENAMHQVIHQLVDVEHLPTVGMINGEEHTTDEKQVTDWRTHYLVAELKQRQMYDPQLIYTGDYGTQSGYDQMKKMIADLGVDGLPAGLFIANDPMAVGAMKAIAEAGVKIPEQMSVISFNDTPIIRYTFPSMSAIHVATDEMGESAVDILRRRVAHPNGEPQKTVIGTRLVKRQTTK